MRLPELSTPIFKYYIPHDINGALTKSIELSIVPEDSYSQMEIFFSLDAKFYIIEEKPAQHLIEKGVGIKFGQNDFAWCVRCYVYLIVNIYKEQRYYVSSYSRQYNDGLSKGMALTVMINPF